MVRRVPVGRPPVSTVTQLPQLPQKRDTGPLLATVYRGDRTVTGQSHAAARRDQSKSA